MHYFVSRLSIVKSLGSTYFNFPSSETFQTENPCKWRQQIHFNFGVSVFSVLISQKYEYGVNKKKLIVTYEAGAINVLLSVLKKNSKMKICSKVTEMSPSALKKMSKLRSQKILLISLLLMMTLSPVMIKQRYGLRRMDFCGVSSSI